ncbi:MAG: hypothetical protein ACYCS7_05635 [Acidimicrobiales bacterium]
MGPGAIDTLTGGRRDDHDLTRQIVTATATLLSARYDPGAN